MPEVLPLYIPIVFTLTTFATLLLFVSATNNSASAPVAKNSKAILLALTAWLLIQAAISLNGVYYSDTTSFPPKIMPFGLLPVILSIIILFAHPAGRNFIDSLPLNRLTYLHTVRIPVELVLFWLSVHKAVPDLMTFAGRNFDILAGLTAPVVAYFGFEKKKLGRGFILTWNLICLGLLLNIMVNAFLSTPSPVQQFAFDQPNVAILHFPYSWLPGFVAPMVLFCHLVAIRQLIRRK